jgi:sugar-specific transcriptional regulator TrmB
MLVQKDLINKLKHFGLNSYESKIWTALLSRGVSTAGELSDIANVPRSRSYDVLESLEKKGFIVMKLGKPIKYIAVDPTEVVERVKRRIAEDSKQRENDLEKIKESPLLQELNTLHKQGIDLVEPTDLTGSFKSRENINDQIEMMLNNAQSSIVIMTTEQGLIRKAKLLKKAMKRLKDKKLNIKIVAPLTIKSKEIVAELKDFADVRHSDKIKARFVAVDNKELMFMLLDDEKVHPNYDTGVWISSQFFTGSFINLFNASWTGLPKTKE